MPKTQIVNMADVDRPGEVAKLFNEVLGRLNSLENPPENKKKKKKGAK